MPENDYSVELGLLLNDSNVSTIKEQIKNLGNEEIKLEFDLSHIKSQISTVKKEIQSLGNVKFKLGNINAGIDFSNVTGSVDKIKLNYNELMNTIKKMGSLKVKISGLDATKDSEQISVLTKQLDSLQTKIQIIQATYKNQWDTGQLRAIEEAFAEIGQDVDLINAKMSDKASMTASKNAIKDIESTYKELLNISKQISNTEIGIKKLSGIENSDNQVALLTEKLEVLRETYNKLQTQLQGNLSSEQMSALDNEIYNTQDKLLMLDAQIEDTKIKIASAFQQKISNGTIETEIESIEQKIIALGSAGNKLEQKLQELRNIQISVDSDSSVENVVMQQGKYNELIVETNNLLKQEAISQKEINDVTKQQQAYTNFLNDKVSLSNQMTIWLKNNSAAAKQFGSQIEALKLELESCDEVRFTGIKNEFKQIVQQATIAGKNVKTMTDQFKSKLKSLETYFSAVMLFTYAIQGLKNMYDKVLDINTAMVELKKVTDDTNATYSSFLDNAANEASSVSATISEYIQVASDYGRLGYNVNDASDLAKTALLYNNVGDEIDSVDDATSSLISTMNGFNIAAEDSLDIVDKFNEVSNNFSISSGGIGEALQRSASSLSAANNSLDQSIALITAANTIVQDPDSVGTAFKTKLIINCLYVQ